MSDGKNSNIHVTMHITEGEEKSETSYQAAANFFEKDEKFFLFFDEKNEDDNAITKCRFEISDDALRIRRNGPIVVEQIHRIDQETNGYIKTPFGHMDTGLQTFQFSFTHEADGNYHLNLGYDLYIGGTKTGTYLLEMVIIGR